MASELRVNTLKDAAGSNSVGMSYVANGSAKAWCHFDAAATLTDRNSLNTSSLTDNGTGDHTITFSSAFANIYLALSGGGDHDGDIVSRRDSSYATTTTTERFCLATSGGSLVDRDRANVLFHGDLA